MTKILCVADNEYCRKYKPCIDSQKIYAKKFGYDYILISGEKESRNWKRSKIEELERLLKDTNNDILLIDGDCYIKDLCPPMNFLNKKNSIYYVVGKSERLNSGFLYFKNNNVSRQFVTELQEKLKVPIPKGKGFFVTREGENGHLIWLKSEWIEKEKDVFCKIPKLWNCSSPALKNDAYILHFTNDLKKEYYKYK